MRILVTGGGGFAGQHLLQLLLEQGAHELSAGTLSGGAPEGGTLDPRGRSAIRWLPLDVTSTASVRQAVEQCRPEWVFHLAGQASVGESFADPLATWEVNATGTLRLLEELRRLEQSDLRVLVVSSAEVYGAVPEDRQPIGEGEPLRPLTPYGASKAAAEAVALQAAAAGELHVVVSRSFNHVGPGQDERFVLPSMARQLARTHAADGSVLRVGNLEVRRDFLDVRDVARAYLRIMESGQSGQVYNVCSGVALPLREVVEELVRLSGTGARIEVDPQRFRPADIPLLVGDPSRLRALGWEPTVPLAETLSDLLEWTRGVRTE